MCVYTAASRSQSSKASLSGKQLGVGWQTLDAAPRGPGGRWGHAMAFDSNRNRGVFFGGCALPPGPSKSKALGDTWEQFEEGVAVDASSTSGTSTPNTSTSSSQTVTSPQPVTSTQPAPSTNTSSTASTSDTPAPTHQYVHWDPTITSVTVSPAVVKEGTPVTLYYGMSPPPRFDPNITVVQVSKLVRLSVSKVVGNGSLKLLDFQHECWWQPPYPLVLAEGYYSIWVNLAGRPPRLCLQFNQHSAPHRRRRLCLPFILVHLHRLTCLRRRL